MGEVNFPKGKQKAGALIMTSNGRDKMINWFRLPAFEATSCSLK